MASSSKFKSDRSPVGVYEESSWLTARREPDRAQVGVPMIADPGCTRAKAEAEFVNEHDDRTVFHEAIHPSIRLFRLGLCTFLTSRDRQNSCMGQVPTPVSIVA